MGLTLQDIFCQHYADYERTHPFPLHVRKAAQAIMQCRTAPSTWYSQLGKPWMLREGVGLRSPIYTTQDVYDELKQKRALAFRWRVWAVDSDLKNGKKSPWCQLAFSGQRPN